MRTHEYCLTETKEDVNETVQHQKAIVTHNGMNEIAR